MKKANKQQPTIFTIFGGTGDLAARKLIPALYNLYLDNHMPEQFTIVGLGRTEHSNESYREVLLDGLNKYSRSGKAATDKWKVFSSNILYLQSDASKEKTYTDLAAIIAEKDQQWNALPTIIHYLSVAPQFFPVIAENISKIEMTGGKDRNRIVIEKPFGRDLETAKELNALLQSLFDETQIYRIDHYLGKETVQNMMAFRFANALFEPIWNRNYIEHVQISVTEDIGIEDRGGYYDGSGALRDMVQNHILQVLCLVAMEPPVSFNADEVRNRRVDVLKAIRRFGHEEVKNNAVRGQYAGGWVAGKEVQGYREEKGVDPNSNTETFCAFKFFIDNWRWQNVPFY
ncbi:glucose-6-phosphate dehydrogenase, partial [Pseudoxanthomonas sp. SGD-10]